MAKVKLKLKDTGGAGLRTCGVFFGRDKYKKPIPTEVDDKFLPYLMDKYSHKLVRHHAGDEASTKRRVAIPDVKDPLEMSRAERRRAKNREIETENAAADGEDDALSEDEEIVATPEVTPPPKKPVAKKKKPAKKKTKKKTKKKAAKPVVDGKDGEALVGGDPA